MVFGDFIFRPNQFGSLKKCNLLVVGASNDGLLRFSVSAICFRSGKSKDTVILRLTGQNPADNNFLLFSSQNEKPKNL
jgi:hypothetical protein